ncbi:capsule biosynthesis protein [Lonepinella sp. MS14435]|uniref:capsule biosynthesis protein n=1 Tax=unclassified Lonepinella TaxID=2642006 RepID=UPI0036DA1CFC
MTEQKQTPARKIKKRNKLLWITVIIPTIISTIYFSLIASDVYISESSFVIRSSQNQTSLSNVGSILQGFGFARSQDDTYTVQEYMKSRNALEELQKVLPMRDFYEQKGDIISRFNSFGLFPEQEAFYNYFTKKETVSIDSVSGIAILHIRSFSAEDSQKINAELLKQGEVIINRLNERARKDTIIFSEQAVREAEERVEITGEALSNYRIKNGIFDVKAQSEVQLTLISKLQDELIGIRTQLDQLRALAPENPQIATLRTREKSVKAEVNKQIQEVLGQGKSIANQTAEYQRLVLDNTLAQQQLMTAMTSLQNSKNEADRKQLYLEIINQPSNPDLALEPYRLYNILATFFIGLLLYGVLGLLFASVREHRN